LERVSTSAADIHADADIIGTTVRVTAGRDVGTRAGLFVTQHINGRPTKTHIPICGHTCIEVRGTSAHSTWNLDCAVDGVLDAFTRLEIAMCTVAVGRGTVAAFFIVGASTRRFDHDDATDVGYAEVCAAFVIEGGTRRISVIVGSFGTSTATAAVGACRGILALALAVAGVGRAFVKVVAGNGIARGSATRG